MLKTGFCKKVHIRGFVNEPTKCISFQRESQDSSNSKSLEDFLSEPEKAENCAHKLEVNSYICMGESFQFILN